MNKWTVLISLCVDNYSETHMSFIRNLEIHCAISSFGLIQADGTRDLSLSPKHLETVQTILALCWQHPLIFSVEIVRPKPNVPVDANPPTSV